MSGSTDQPSGPQLPTPSKLRVIGLALLGGPLVFAVIVGVLSADDSGTAVAHLSPTIGLILAGVAAVNIGIAFLMRGIAFGRIAGAKPSTQAQTYMSGTLIYLAFLESAMLLGVLAWFLTGDPVPGVIPAVLAFAIGLATLPGDEQFESLKR